MLNLPTPKNISVWWNFGSLLGLILGVQILTGLFLSMHYISDVGQAFSSVRHIIREVNNGWWLRYIHANGASFFFIFIYLHIGRGLYYGRYTYIRTWYIGFLMLLILMGTAFLGYVLPWGQMSFWGATVITNLITAFPFGGDLVLWVWGGFSVDQPTLTRFYSLHFLIPLLLRLLAIFHVILLHRTGSNNPLGLNSDREKIPFHSYFTIKDIVGFIFSFLILISLTFFSPNLLGEPDNYARANPLITPPHIVPEWYFLFAYAILRSIPNKLGGVLGLLLAIIILTLIPLIGGKIKSCSLLPLSKIIFWIFSASFLLLTIAGSWPVEEPYRSYRRLFAIIYFRSFFSLMPSRSFSEHSMYT